MYKGACVRTVLHGTVRQLHIVQGHPVADGAVHNIGVGPDQAVLADGGVPQQDGAGQNGGAGADLYRVSDHHTVGAGSVYAVYHQLVHDLVAQDFVENVQLGSVVGTQYHIAVLNYIGVGAAAGTQQNGKAVG